MQTNNKKEIILFGAGVKGEKALGYYGARNVYCFADNFNYGKIFCGKRVISFDELQQISNNYEIIISTASVWEAEICEQLREAGIRFSCYLDDILNYQRYTFNSASIQNFKNLYDNQEIFLIGNGPSLTVQDLETIQKNEIKTFACNLIYKIFDKTFWRPDFYCCIEDSAIAISKDFILHVPITAKFIKAISEPPLFKLFDGEKMPDDVYFYVVDRCQERFSPDVSYVVYDGSTVMYTMIEFAVYMGFKTIYLLGVENTQPPAVYTKDFIGMNAHFYKEDKVELEIRKKIMKKSEISDDWDLYQQITTKHYSIARAYAEDHGIKIYNATRGGKLEVFERVDFETLF